MSRLWNIQSHHYVSGPHVRHCKATSACSTGAGLIAHVAVRAPRLPRNDGATADDGQASAEGGNERPSLACAGVHTRTFARLRVRHAAERSSGLGIPCPYSFFLCEVPLAACPDPHQHATIHRETDRLRERRAKREIGRASCRERV